MLFERIVPRSNHAFHEGDQAAIENCFGEKGWYNGCGNTLSIARHITELCHICIGCPREESANKKPPSDQLTYDIQSAVT